MKRTKAGWWQHANLTVWQHLCTVKVAPPTGSTNLSHFLLKNHSLEARRCRWSPCIEAKLGHGVERRPDPVLCWEPARSTSRGSDPLLSSAHRYLGGRKETLLQRPPYRGFQRSCLSTSTGHHTSVHLLKRRSVGRDSITCARWLIANLKT